LGVVGFFAKFITFFNYTLNRANIVPILTHFTYFSPNKRFFNDK
jgi:hypothetical protein